MRTSTELYELAAQYRGKFINELSWMEKFMDTYIAKYFVGDNDVKLADMHLLFLGDGRISLENKRQIFHEIASKYDSEWYNSYIPVFTDPKTIKSPTIAMNKELVSIIAMRNILAHRIVDTTVEGLENDDVISFFTYKNTFKKETLSHNDYSGYIFGIMAITKYLRERVEK
ncbi:hypothetical protein [Pedobacter helvus]|uniref:pEK499-p136 HEPN domain-containing protein n=1 Tax=Pedobacter helvus TaxID=2563444 RepID=A0ABW9JMF0_9SPHI|nr:hypothetical protein [Pedobacter ureilyticus]